VCESTLFLGSVVKKTPHRKPNHVACGEDRQLSGEIVSAFLKVWSSLVGVDDAHMHVTQALAFYMLENT
jgi:hypothetical protein